MGRERDFYLIRGEVQVSVFHYFPYAVNLIPRGYLIHIKETDQTANCFCGQPGGRLRKVGVSDAHLPDQPMSVLDNLIHQWGSLWRSSPS